MVNGKFISSVSRQKAKIYIFQKKKSSKNYLILKFREIKPSPDLRQLIENSFDSEKKTEDKFWLTMATCWQQTTAQNTAHFIAFSHFENMK